MTSRRLSSACIFREMFEPIVHAKSSVKVACRTRQTERQAAAAEASKAPAGQDTGLSYMQLLGLDDEALPAGAPLAPPLLFERGASARPDHTAPPWQRLVAPPGVAVLPHAPGQVGEVR